MLGMIFLSLLVLFTALRNLSSLYYLIPGLFFFYFMVKYAGDFLVLHRHRMEFDLYFVATLCVIAWSFIYMGSLEPVPGVPRILLMPLLAVLAFRWAATAEDITRLVNWGFFALLVGALSLFYQMYAGAISWFADAVQRSDLDRYSTILGSLTIFGSIVGYAVIILLYGLTGLRPVIRGLLLTTIILAGLASLQKSAVASILLAILFGLGAAIYTRDRRRLMQFLGLLTILMLGLILALQLVPAVKLYFDATLVTTFGRDVPFVDASAIKRDSYALDEKSIGDRLYRIPIGAIEYYGPMVFFLGVGLQGGAGTMGMEGQSAHNTIGDLVIMGGPVYITLFLVLYFKVQTILFRNIDRPNSLSLFLCNILFLINCLAAAGIVNQPATSFLFWVSVVYSFKFLRTPSLKTAQSFRSKLPVDAASNSANSSSPGLG